MALPNLVQIKQALDKMMPELSPVPIGSIAYAHEVPTGWLECNGAAISRTKYARLFKKIGTKYGAGDGSTTFNLPNLHHRVLEATTTISEVAKMVEAGLPDITGTAKSGGDETDAWVLYGACSGAISPRSATRSKELATIPGDTVGTCGFNFNAQYSSACYGNSKTVQPNALRLLAVIKS